MLLNNKSLPHFPYRLIYIFISYYTLLLTNTNTNNLFQNKIKKSYYYYMLFLFITPKQVSIMTKSKCIYIVIFFG